MKQMTGFDGVDIDGDLDNLFSFGFPMLAPALTVLEPALSSTDSGEQIYQHVKLS
ncbi:hypothetical protein OROMI_012792 [Orobanche minor]